MNGFAGAEIDGLSSHLHFLSLEAGEVHFDAMALAVVKGVMLKRVEPEGAVQFAVNSRQQIEIELCGDAFGIVIRSIEHIGRFDQIGTDNKYGALTQNICSILQKSRRIMRLKISDG